MSLLSVTVVLFLLMDPMGNVSSFLKLTNDLPPRRRTLVIIREMLIALAAMLIFAFLGSYLLDFLDVSDTTIHISSGIILFLVAIKILFPGTTSLRETYTQHSGEPYIVPLAIPLIAGPSLLATIILYSRMENVQSIMLLAILIAWLLSMIILLSSHFLKKALKDNGLNACEKLMGMILVLLATQRIFEGIQLFFNEYTSKN